MKTPYVHWTCLFCRKRRKLYRGFSDTRWLIYPYLSMQHRSHAVQFNGGKPILFWVHMPHLLMIDPRGHFLHFRVAAIMVLDRLGLKLKFALHRIANMCEFLANYPTI